MKKSIWCLTILLAVSTSLQAAETPSPKYKYKVPAKLSDDWEVADFRGEKIDLNKLSLGVDKILKGEIADVHSLLVFRHGKLVLEEYFNGSKAQDTHKLYSCTKSVFSALYGIAQDQGLLKLKQKVYDLYPEARSRAGWDKKKNKITVAMLLSMTSGLGCDDSGASVPDCSDSMKKTSDWLAFCHDLPLAHSAGTTWTYNGACLVLLSNKIAEKSGMSFVQYASKYLLDPLGIKGHSLIVGPNGVTGVDTGFEWTPRDMGKFGQLFLNQGMWKGKRILSRAWIKDSTTIHAPKGEAFGGDYGYLWYVTKMKYRGKMVKEYQASGYSGQHIVVCHDADLVCVMTADGKGNAIYHQEDDLFENYILGCFK